MVLPRLLRSLLVSAVAICAVVGSAGPAQAAYPTSDFAVYYGNSWVAGTTTWYNRSVNLTGNMKTTAGNCRELHVRTYAGSTLLSGFYGPNGWACTDGPESLVTPFSVNVSADIYGGPTHIVICIAGTPRYSNVMPGSYPELACGTYYVPGS